MGWQDAPLVEDEAPAGNTPSWMAAPEEGVSQDVATAQPAPPVPTMGQVALNAVPKGVANVLHTPNLINHLVLKGLASLPGMDTAPEIKKMLQEASDKFGNNGIMSLMEKTSVVNPDHNPQTGPQRIVDAAIQGAVSAAVVPGKALLDTGKSALMGAASAATGKTTEEIVKPFVGETAAHWIGVATGAIVPLAPLAAPSFRVVKPAPHSELNTKTRLQTLKDGQEIGLVAQPTSVRPSVMNQIKESVAGPGKLNLAASIKNQRAATEAAKKELGLPASAELDAATFKALKDTAAVPYRELSSLPGGKNLLEQLQQKRSDASAFWRANGSTPSPELRKAALQAEQEATQFEMAIDQLAQQSGVPGLLQRVRGAREGLAKIYDVESATNVGDGHVVMSVLGGMKDAGRPLSGHLDTLGRWWNAFKPVSREGSGLGTVASGTDAASAALLATTGSNSSSLIGTLAGAAPGLRSAARNNLLSDKTQKSLLDMGGTQGLKELTPKALRGLSRSGMVGSALHNTQEKGEKQ